MALRMHGSCAIFFRRIPMPQVLLMFRRYIPSLPILSVAHPEWKHWWKRCYAAARWHPDGSVPEAFQKLLFSKAAYPDTSPHKPDSRKRCGIPSLLPSLNFPRCKCPGAGDKILSFLFRWFPYKEPPHLQAAFERLPLWRCRTYPGVSWCGCL